MRVNRGTEIQKQRQKAITNSSQQSPATSYEQLHAFVTHLEVGPEIASVSFELNSLHSETFYAKYG
jgi:hypothetical protein